MNDTMKEIKQRADQVLDGKQGWDALALRKALINISNLALAELSAGELKIQEPRTGA